MKIAMIAALCIAALAALFAVQNAQQTQVSFMGWYFDGPLVIVLLLTFAAGALTAFLAVLPSSLRKSIEISRLRASIPVAKTDNAQTALGGAEHKEQLP